MAKPLGVHVVPAVGDHRLSDARALILEYLAATFAERGRPFPAEISALPPVFRAECDDLARAYPAPGTLLLAYQQTVPVGCVGVKPLPFEVAGDTVTGEITRLYVRPAHRRHGLADMLMRHAHRHAAHHGFRRLTLDVIPSRRHVVRFYQSLGYTEIPPYSNHSPDENVYLALSIACC